MLHQYSDQFWKHRWPSLNAVGSIFSRLRESEGVRFSNPARRNAGTQNGWIEPSNVADYFIFICFWRACSIAVDSSCVFLQRFPKLIGRVLSGDGIPTICMPELLYTGRKKLTLICKLVRISIKRLTFAICCFLLSAWSVVAGILKFS